MSIGMESLWLCREIKRTVPISSHSENTIQQHLYGPIIYSDLRVLLSTCAMARAFRKLLKIREIFLCFMKIFLGR
jgi:hypothetical protein